MITKLKKYTFLVYHREHNEFLTKLRDIGVVHIIEKGKSDQEAPFGELTGLLKRHDNAIRFLTKKLPENSIVKPPASDSPDSEATVSLVESLIIEIEELKNRIGILKNESAKLEPWGAYEVSSIERLYKEGCAISLFTCPTKKFNTEWQEKFSIIEINEFRGKTYFAIVHRPGEVIDIEADQERIGEKSAPQLNLEIENVNKSIADTEERIVKSAPEWIEIIKGGRLDLLNRIEYSDAESKSVFEADGRLIVLQGWVPVESEKELKEAVENTDYYYFETEPDPGENIPVKLRNGNFAKLFEPISKLFALPDYNELDLTPFFAPFFMLFFGFCLGDAGYGLLFIAIGFLLYKKVPKNIRPFLTLAKYLGVATIVFGIIGGTFFGMNLIDSGYTITENSLAQMTSEEVPANILASLNDIKGERFLSRKEYLTEVGNLVGPEMVKTYRKEFLKSAEGDFSLLKSFRHLMLDSISMFYFAILLGAIQIIFGMIVKIINITIHRGFKYCLSTVGWVLLFITMIVFKGGEAAGIMNPETTKPFFYAMMGISGILIFFLNDLSLNIFFRVGSGVWDTYNVATGVFGDLLSYIRLFALGISSAILGFVFNDISSQFLEIPYVGWIFFVLLLLIGHTINIFMAALGGFIHPMRLTFVEFYKNAGFKGGGKAFKPFKINS